MNRNPTDRVTPATTNDNPRTTCTTIIKPHRFANFPPVPTIRTTSAASSTGYVNLIACCTGTCMCGTCQCHAAHLH